MRMSTVSVFSMKENRLWTIHHNTFRLEPRQGDFRFNEFGFQWTDSVFSIALGPRLRNGYRLAFYHAMASLSEYAVSTQVLRNESLATRSYHGNDFKYVGSRPPFSQSNMHDIDIASNIMIHTEVAKNAIGCWNTYQKFTMGQDIIAYNNETMIYPSDLKIDQESTIWFLTNRIPFFVFGKLDVNDYNYRVFRKNVNDAVQGTRCGPRRYQYDLMYW